MSTTARGGLPTPEAVDPADVPQDMLELATQLALVFALYDVGVAAGRPGADANHEGMWYLTIDGADAPVLEFCNGAAWVQVPIAGGSMKRAEVRKLKLRDSTETVVDKGNVNGNPVNVDLAAGNVQRMALTGNTTLAFTNPPPGGEAAHLTLFISQDATGGRVLTLPAGIRWSGGVAPVASLGANALDIWEFTYYNTLWYGWQPMKNAAA